MSDEKQTLESMKKLSGRAGTTKFKDKDEKRRKPNSLVGFSTRNFEPKLLPLFTFMVPVTFILMAIIVIIIIATVSVDAAISHRLYHLEP